MQNIIFRPDTRAWLQWLFAFNASLSFAGNSGRLTRERQTVARAALPTVTSECGVFSCVSINNNVANVFCFFLTRAQMLMHAIAHWGCADTVRESALTADSGRKSLFSPRTRTRVSIAPGFSPSRTIYHGNSCPSRLWWRWERSSWNDVLARAVLQSEIELGSYVLYAAATTDDRAPAIPRSATIIQGSDNHR